MIAIRRLCFLVILITLTSCQNNQASGKGLETKKQKILAYSSQPHDSLSRKTDGNWIRKTYYKSGHRLYETLNRDSFVGAIIFCSENERFELRRETNQDHQL